MNTCGSCAFWVNKDDREFGACTKVGWDLSGHAQFFVAGDGGGYDFMTHPTFGCTEWRYNQEGRDLGVITDAGLNAHNCG